MSTLYDLFKVKEDATAEQIKESYNKILEKADSLPQNDKIIEQVRRVKIAYGILIDPEKRKKYDSDLARKRAEELLGNIQIKDEPVKEEITQPEIKKNSEDKLSEIDEKRIKQAIEDQINHVVQSQSAEPNLNNDEKLKQEKIKD